MNWNTINFDWDHLKAFLATAEEGSFSGAARALRSTQPTINRQISALETALEITLFERGNRGLLLTSAGAELLEHVQAMGSSASKISMMASSQSEAIEGVVSITAVDIMCQHFILPIMPHLHQQYPQLTIHILASNEIQDLSRREADIAIRHVRPEQQDLTAKLAATFSGQFYAAPQYIQQRGPVRSTEDLQSCQIIGASDPERFIAIAKEHGITLHKNQFSHASNSGIIDIEMVRAGLGVALLADQVCKYDPALVPLHPDIPSIEFPVWLTTHRELHTSKKIRVVFNALKERLSIKTGR